MTKTVSSSERNVENIRRKNLEDNQLFLQQLLMTNIRNDFLHSAKSILRKDGDSQIKKKHTLQQQKVDRATRYSEKVKSGVIGPFVPEWQRLIEEKKKEAEERLMEKERKKEERLLEKESKRIEREQKEEERLLEKELKQIERELIFEERRKIMLAKQRPPKPSRWTLYYKNSLNSKPYQRTFIPRHTKVGERIEQNL